MFLARVASWRRSVWIGPKSLGKNFTAGTGSRFSVPKHATDARANAPSNDLAKGFTRLFVQNVPLDATWEELQDHFAASGAKYVTLSVDQTTQKPKGCGLISYDTLESAENAVRTMNGSALRSNVLSVRLDRKMGETGTFVASSGKSGAGVVQSGGIRKGGGETPISPDAAAAVAKECVAQIKGKYAMAGRSHKSLRSLIRDSKTAELQKLEESKKDSHGGSQSVRTGASMIDTQAVPPVGAVNAGGFSRLTTDNIRMPPTVLARVQELLVQRTAHRDARDFARADEVLTLLRHKYGVQCDDLRRQWRVKFVPRGGPVPTAGAARDDELVSPTKRPLVIKLLRALANEVPELSRPSNGSEETAQVASRPTAASTQLETPESASSLSTSASAPATAPYARDSKDVVYLSRTEMATVTDLVKQRACLLAVPTSDPSAVAETEKRLREEFSVYCDDTARTWAVVYDRQKARAGASEGRGGSQRDRTGQRESGSVSERLASPVSTAGSSGRYRRDRSDLVNLTRGEFASVIELVNKRASLLSDPVARAAELKEVESRLAEEFNVQCDDTTRTWAVVYKRSSPNTSARPGSRGDGASPVRNSRRSYSTSIVRWAGLGGDGAGLSPSAASISTYQRDRSDRSALKRDDEVEIEGLVSRRAGLLQGGDESGAAWIADQLMQFHGVACDDERRTWAVVLDAAQDATQAGPASGRAQGKAAPAPSVAVYTRDPSDIVYVGRTEVVAITAQVQERVRFLADGNLAAAVEIADTLRADYSVECDDGSHTWRVVYDRPGAETKATVPSKHGGSAVAGASLTATSPQKGQKQPAAAEQTVRDSKGAAVSTAPSDNPASPKAAQGFSVTTGTEGAYARDPTDFQDLTPEEVATIAQLVQERAAHRAGRNTAAARSIEDWLRQKFCVRCDDSARTWGVSLELVEQAGLSAPGASGSTGLGYTRSEFDIVYLPPEEVNEITSLVVRYAECQRSQDKRGIKRLDKKLRKQFGVLVDDSTHTWSVNTDLRPAPAVVAPTLTARKRPVSTGRRPPRGAYLRDEMDTAAIEPVDFNTVTTLVNHRSMCLREGDTQGAEKAQRKLLSRFGVECDDSARRWAVRHEVVRAPAIEAYRRKRGNKPDLPRSITCTIENLTRERLRYLGSAKPWEQRRLADLDARLLREFNVVCNDVRKTYKVVARDSATEEDGCAPAPFRRDKRDTNALSEETRVQIEALVQQRAVLVDQGQRSEAAAVAQQLRQEFGVFIKDVARTWRATSAEERQRFEKVAEGHRAK